MLDGNVYYGDDDDYKDTNDAFYQNKRAKIYVAPEHARSEEFEPTAAGDVYAFAIILIEIATRNDPFGVGGRISIKTTSCI
ncbi:hypothetical protein DPMN_082947 [Dreissena polymorpha]|uniref:Protein kinase domain-containing protein n=1 Tax=Dreissena polymorpha TaxID=45954 RepID=A0A9D3Y909_DREPO|nr:hypothetical protein DPMN_082947 [Dreissena polymorpha]